jgi:tetratricopeptide (TPR) repeat protein
LWLTVSRTVIAVLVLILAFSLKPLVFDHSFVIGDFSIPDELKTKGLTSNTIGHQLFERIVEIQRVAKAAVAEKNLSVQAFESNKGVAKLADVKLPGADVNLGLMVSQLRTFFRIADTAIVGELGLVKREDNIIYQLRAYVSGTQLWSSQAEGTDLANVITRLADNLVEHFDPLSAGFFYLHRPNDEKSNLDRVIAITDRILPVNQQEAVWTLTLRGMAWREKQGFPERASSSLCAAIAVDPSFTPAWRTLAMALRSDEKLAVAQDLALRLIRIRPHDPEGFRQLGAVHGECAENFEQTPSAQMFFEHALTMDSGRYLTLVDYAKWLYSHFEPEKPNYLDMAVQHFERAQALAPNETSVYTNFARGLGHPRIGRHEEPSDTAARYLHAEMKARAALAQNEHSPFANFVMGELLTDEAVLEHRYRNSKRFSEALPYLQRAREAATYPETLYEALAARAEAGRGDFDKATQILSQIANPKRPSYLVEWIYGEMLYNRSFKTPAEKGRLLPEALTHLRLARSVHACGTRSDVISDLIVRIENELKNDHTDEQGVVRSEVTVDLPTNLSATDSRNSLRSQPVDWKPVCPGWQKWDIDPLAPYEPDPALAIAIPVFDAAH